MCQDPCFKKDTVKVSLFYIQVTESFPPKSATILKCNSWIVLFGKTGAGLKT